MKYRTDIWIYQKRFHTPQDARKKLLSLTKVSKLIKGDDKGEFFAETDANKTPQTISQGGKK